MNQVHALKKYHIFALVAIVAFSFIYASVAFAAKPDFKNDLKKGSEGPEVIELQTFLESKGFLVMPQGVAKGFFGDLTLQALAKYQERSGIFPAAGYFGPMTRARINTEDTPAAVKASENSAINVQPIITSITINSDEGKLLIMGDGFSTSNELGKANTVVIANERMDKVFAQSQVTTDKATEISVNFPAGNYVGQYLVVIVKNDSRSFISQPFKTSIPVQTPVIRVDGSGGSRSSSGSSDAPAPAPSGSPCVSCGSTNQTNNGGSVNLANIWSAIQAILAQ